ncbi:MAG: porin [Gammaproteobacteria bacterium]|nr:porin [Gammaproteobacteria bacterium]
MFNSKTILIQSLFALVMTGPANAVSKGLDWEIYGSLRVAGEAVNTDGSTNDYDGLRDAYTRFGAKATYTINDDWSILGQLEVPFDLANMELQSPWDPDEDYRIGKLQVSGPLGTAWYGRGWLAFYNYITYPVDYFSSYYSGWQTYTSFRKSETFYYSSPAISGFKFDFATTDEDDTDRNQYVISYSNKGLTLAAGRDDYDGATIDGASASYSTGPWYLSIKYEEQDLEGAPDREIIAGLVQYEIDNKNTVRGYLANGEGVGENVFQVGFDHQYNDSTKFFVEYYDEDGAAAVNAETDPKKYNATGGSVFTVGVRYDFGSK